MLKIKSIIIFLKTTLFLISLLWTPFLVANTLQMKVSDLNEDVGLIMKQVAKLQLEMEILREENKNLKQELSKIEKIHAKLQFVQETQKNQVKHIERNLKAMRNDTLEEISEKMHKLTLSTNATIKELIDTVNKGNLSQTIVENIHFNDNYPKEGIEYKVKKGDTLSVIALKNNSTTGYIQNANRIKDPKKDLKAGQIIFIPQKTQ